MDFSRMTSESLIASIALKASTKICAGKHFVRTAKLVGTAETAILSQTLFVQRLGKAATSAHLASTGLNLATPFAETAPMASGKRILNLFPV